jgi:hypothetical protein
MQRNGFLLRTQRHKEEGSGRMKRFKKKNPEKRLGVFSVFKQLKMNLISAVKRDENR